MRVPVGTRQRTGPPPALIGACFFAFVTGYAWMQAIKMPLWHTALWPVLTFAFIRVLWRSNRLSRTRERIVVALFIVGLLCGHANQHQPIIDTTFNGKTWIEVPTVPHTPTTR